MPTTLDNRHYRRFQYVCANVRRTINGLRVVYALPAQAVAFAGDGRECFAFYMRPERAFIVTRPQRVANDN